MPPVDVYEDEHSIQLKLEVPGIDEKDLDIKVENNVLTVSGERKFEKEEKEENFRRVERRYGSFVRSFTLPTTVDSEGITADYTAGVLKLKLAKRAEAKPKQIKVNIGGQKTIESWQEPGSVNHRSSGRIAGVALRSQREADRLRLPFFVPPTDS